MSWIDTIAPEEATGRLARIYARVADASGHVDHILQVHSLRPRTLEGHLAIYKASLHSLPSDLSAREKELMGTVVSSLNDCTYCVEHHRTGLARHLGAEGDARARELVAAALGESDSSALTPRERAMTRYATMLTRTPGDLGPEAVAALREAGLSDAAVLELNQVVAYFAYANRTVLGLGVEIAGEVLGMHPPEDDTDDVRHG